MTNSQQSQQSHNQLRETTHDFEDAHYGRLSDADEWLAVKMNAIEAADKLRERRLFWSHIIDILLYLFSGICIGAMLTIGAWLPPLLVFVGFSK